MCQMNIEKTASNYIRWNEAFLEYFFPEGRNSNEEIILYVNNGIINCIGEKNGLGGSEDFLKAVLIPKENRCAFFSEIREHAGYATETNAVINVNRASKRSLFAFAASLTQEEFCRTDNCNRRFKQCPFLNYVILVIYLASEVVSQDEDRAHSLGKLLNSVLKDRFQFDEEIKRDKIELLFDKLNIIFKEFKNKKITRHRYVGLLKYQLVLSPSQIKNLRTVLFENGFEYDESESYQDNAKRVQFYDLDDQSLRRIINLSCKFEEQYKAYRIRLQDILENFDVNQYEKDNVKNIKGCFCRALYLGGEGNNRLVLLTNMKYNADKQNSSNKNEIISITEEPFDSIAGYNPNHVLLDGHDRVSVDKKVSINDGGIVIKPISQKSNVNQDIIFFRRYKETPYYIETFDTTVKGKYYVAIRKDIKTLKKPWKTFFESNNCIKIENKEKVSTILGSEQWDLFRPKSCFPDPPFYDQDAIRKTSSSNKTNDSQEIFRAGGVKYAGLSDVYLPLGLPHIVFPDDGSIDKIDIYIAIDGQEQKKDLNYKVVVFNKKCLLISLIDINLAEEYQAELTLSVKDTEGRVIFEDSYSICKPKPDFSEFKLNRYNGWGEILFENDCPQKYIEGYDVKGIDDHEYSSVMDLRGRNTVEFDEVIRRDLRSFSLINILSDCFVMSENCEITPHVFEKCILCGGKHKGVDLSDHIRLVKNFLITSGYVTYNYNSRRYQAVPTTFIQTRTIEGDKNEGIKNVKRFILGGCYTYDFLVDLIAYCLKKNIKIFFLKDSFLTKPSIEAFLPPVILINEGFNPEDFRKENKHEFKLLEGDLALKMLNFIPNVSDLDNYPRKNHIAHLKPTTSKVYPQIRDINAKIYCRYSYVELSEGSFLDRPMRNTSWLDMYCAYYIKKKILLYSGKGLLCFPSSFHIPYLLQKTFFLMNLGQPRFCKAFILNNNLTSDVLYSNVKIYDIGISSDQKSNARLKRIFEIYTNKGIDGNEMVCEKIERLDYSYNKGRFKIELWKSSDEFYSGYNTLIVLIKDRVPIIAASSKKDVFCMNEGTWKRVIKGSPNEIISNIILGKSSPKNTEMQIDKAFSMPQKEKYTIEEIKDIL